MLKMDMYEYIRFAGLQLGKSISAISKDTGKDWRTVKKAIEGMLPKYNLAASRPKPLMDNYIEMVTEWLEADKEVPKKQRHTAKRIYDRLVEEHGFTGNDSTVRKTVRTLKEELNLLSKEGFIPSDPEKRKGAEFDWGDVYIDLEDTRTKVYMFCMRAKYSAKFFLKLYPVMLQECFFNGHIEAFAYFGGIFDQIVYDNLAAAVKRVLTGSNRIEQSSFMAFRSYYCFNPIFCNRQKGSEKGGVEGLVGFARRNFLTPIPKCKSLDEINAKLLEKCFARDLQRTQGCHQTIGELFEQEKPRLVALPKRPYNNYKLIETTADKYLTVKIKTNRYSVPESYVGKHVTIELGLYDVRITHKNRLIAEHRREFQANKWILNPWHFMQLLRRKSRAFSTSRILTAIEKDWDPVVKRLWKMQVSKYGESQGTKDFLDALLFFKDKSYEDMIAVLELSLENNTTNPESVKVLFETLTEREIKVEEASIDHLAPISHFTLPDPDVHKFDTLMEAARDGQ